MDTERTDAIRSTKGYLHRTAMNLMRDKERSEARSAPLSSEGDTADQGGPDPVAGLEARDLLKRIEAVIARMPTRRREVFLAHRIDG